eukprot:1442147-Pyramimonas_sp.AAC.1
MCALCAAGSVHLARSGHRRSAGVRVNRSAGRAAPHERPLHRVRLHLQLPGAHHKRKKLPLDVPLRQDLPLRRCSPKKMFPKEKMFP